MHQSNPAKRNTLAGFRTLNTWAVIGVVGLFSSLAWLAGSSGHGMTTSASAHAPMSAPTPPLDKEAADALVEQLKETLADSIEDEAVVTSIKERWDARIVANKTRKQIIDLLFADVRSIVSDKAKQDAVWESWKEIAAEPESEEPGPAPEPPKPVTPPVAPASVPRSGPGGITKQTPFHFGNDEKIRIGHDQMVSFFSDQGIGGVKTWVQEKGNYGRQSYTIYKDMDDPDINIKVAAVHKSVKTLIDRGVRIPDDLRVYCAKHTSPTQQRAIIRGERWAPVAIVFLVWARPRSFELGSLSQEPTPGFDRATISMIHEIGHILHERAMGDLFWMEEFKGKAPDEVASKVSFYARNSRKEFAAEVFAGMFVGKRWSPDVLAYYHEIRGPYVP